MRTTRNSAHGPARTLPILLLALTFVVLGGVFAGAFFLSTLVVPDASQIAPTAAIIGAQAPDLSLLKLENGKAGSPVTLKELRGHPVVLNFWATWCPPCVEEFPVLDQVLREHRSTDGVQVIAVNIEDGSTPAELQKFVNGLGVTFPIWLTGPEDYSAEEAFAVKAMPTTFFIDADGIIRQIRVGGPMSRAYIEEQLLLLK